MKEEHLFTLEGRRKVIGNLMEPLLCDKQGFGDTSCEPLSDFMVLEKILAPHKGIDPLPFLRFIQERSKELLQFLPDNDPAALTLQRDLEHMAYTAEASAAMYIKRTT
jgi:hypothetical protein